MSEETATPAARPAATEDAGRWAVIVIVEGIEAEPAFRLNSWYGSQEAALGAALALIRDDAKAVICVDATGLILVVPSRRVLMYGIQHEAGLQYEGRRQPDA